MDEQTVIVGKSGSSLSRENRVLDNVALGLLLTVCMVELEVPLTIILL